ncbi:hypothetical protein ACFWXH_02910 [Mesorhizobium sp. NPDC059054]|uniref:hypothetical protein n=1 Tax=Mesorhizobium sp. NPDC059054 TaxID=3346711 RepID=UPI00369CBDB2
MLSLDKWAGEASRFAIAGLFNTAFTLILYQLLVLAITPELGYAIAWITGFLLVVTLYPTAIFRATEVNATGYATVALIYVIAFGLGVTLTHMLSAYPRLAIFGVIPITSAFTYLAMRFALSRYRRP